MMRNVLVTGGVAAALLAVGAVTLVGTAAAAEGSNPTGVITRSTTSYSSPSLRSAPMSSLPKDTQLQVICATEGETPPGSDNFYWIRFADRNGQSYVHRDAITIAPGLKHC